MNAVIAEIQDRVDAISDGEAVLNGVHDFLGRFVAYPTFNCHIAHTLWIAHTHLMAVWDSTPRIAFLSPEPGSGKSRALEVSALLVPHPIEAINATPAYLFRKVADPEGLPTVLFDEIDTVFGPKAKDNEVIRGVLNAGHRRGAMAGRCVLRGKTVETEELPAYCAVAVAGLGHLPDTILTRSVVIRMRRRAPTEKIEQFRRRIEAPAGHQLRDRLAEWAAVAQPCIAFPQMPPGIEDRAADVWEALLAIADAAGGVWPGIARNAAVALVTQAKESSPSLGLRLLADLRTVFVQKESMATSEIIAELAAIEEAPWGDYKGKPINDRQLANLLRQYGVSSKVNRRGTGTLRGYARQDLYDPWMRYLPQSPESVTNVTGETRGRINGLAVTGVTDVTHLVEANAERLQA
jgi:hypothetical protein